MSCLRNAFDGSRRDKRTNEKVLERCDVEVNVKGRAQSYNLRWCGYIEGMKSERKDKTEKERGRNEEKEEREPENEIEG